MFIQAGLSVVLAAASLLTSSAAGPFTLRSPVFQDGAPLPTTAEYGGGFGCHGGNRPPTLSWSGVPAKTKSLALVVIDPDGAAGAVAGWVHWVVYNIPPTVRSLGAASRAMYTQGTTSFGTTGYNGPCPPPDGTVHHYIFTLYALNVGHITAMGLTRPKLLGAMDKHVLSAATIVGTFKHP
jgi:Raf kinase inhibitor-like YbhB/YbcL family protein